MFDGDQQAFFFVTEPLLVAQIERDMSPSNLWFFEKNLKPLYSPTHEVLYGLHLASIVRTRSNKEYVNFNDLERDYLDGKTEVDELVNLDDKMVTYGREKISQILGMNLDSLLGDDKEITSENIASIIGVLNTRPERAKILRDLRRFSAKVATEIGMSTPPFKNLYPANDKIIDEIQKSDDTPEGKYNKLNKRLSDIVLNEIKNLPESNIGILMKGSDRIKPGALMDIYAPALYGDGTIATTNLFQGLSERAFTTKAISNRQILQTKQAQTPVGGYAARQLVVSQMEITYIDEERSPDKVGLLLPMREAYGRTKMDGSKVPKTSSKELVRVKSCINHKEPYVYKDEIANDYFNEKDKSVIGVAFATSFTESKTQAALALKHGGVMETYEEEKIKSLHNGIIEAIGDYVEIRNTDNNDLHKYLVSGKFTFGGKIKIGNRIQKGDLILQSKRLTKVWSNLADFVSLYGMKATDIRRESGRPKCICYSPYEGEISYDGDWVKIGQNAIPISRDEIYYFPEGYKVSEGENICSGLLDPSAFHYYSKNIQLTFDAIKHQVEKLYPSNVVRPELYEVTFKSLIDFDFRADTKYSTNPNFINRMYVGDTKRGLQRAFKESESDTVQIVDSVILPLVIGKKMTI